MESSTCGLGKSSLVAPRSSVREIKWRLGSAQIEMKWAHDVRLFLARPLTFGNCFFLLTSFKRKNSNDRHYILACNRPMGAQDTRGFQLSLLMRSPRHKLITKSVRGFDEETLHFRSF
jgi:hypothetical protein